MYFETGTKVKRNENKKAAEESNSTIYRQKYVQEKKK